MDYNQDRKAETLDGLLMEIGEMGRYQLVNYALLSSIVFFTSINYLSYVFTTGQTMYRCHVPVCEPLSGTISDYSPNWLKFAVPFNADGQPVACRRYQNIYKKMGGLSDDAGLNHYPACDSRFFNQSQLVKCDEFVYDLSDDVTIISAFNITCEENEWRLAFIGTLSYAPQLITLPVCAFLSDRYGRKPVLVAAVLLSGISGLIKSFAINYVMYAAMEFITSMLSGGIYMTVFVMAIEFAGPSKRIFSSTTISVTYCVSQAFLGVEALFIRDFRILLRVLYVPFLLLLSFIWLVPESVRWLMINRKNRRMELLLLRAARMNGVPLDAERIDQMMSEEFSVDLLSTDDGICTHVASKEVRHALRSRRLLFRLFICCTCWFASAFVYNGMSVQSVSLGGNKFVNFILVNLVEVPAILLTSVLMANYGRRRTLYVSLFISAGGCAVAQFASNSSIRLAWYLLGKCAVTVAFTALYVFTSELFPTSMRQSFMNACSMVGALGSMVAPLTPMLAHIWSALPLLMFCGSAIVAGALTVSLPETKNTKLPDTVEDAENINV